MSRQRAKPTHRMGELVWPLMDMRNAEEDAHGQGKQRVLFLDYLESEVGECQDEGHLTES